MRGENLRAQGQNLLSKTLHKIKVSYVDLLWQNICYAMHAYSTQVPIHIPPCFFSFFNQIHGGSYKQMNRMKKI